MMNNDRGFTLIEIIMAITLIGIAVPTIMIPFSGLSDTKNPEYVVQGSYIGQQRIEELSGSTQTSALTDCNAAITAPGYSLSCTAMAVSATDPDVSGAGTFGQRVTLTVTRSDGAMNPLVFTTLVVQD